MDPLIQELTKEQLRDDMPDFRAGDTVRVHVRVVEGTHERIQMFEGVVIAQLTLYVRCHLVLVLNVLSQ